MPAPALVASTIDGTKLTLLGLHGKVVLVTFWATTCTICLAEQPDRVKTYQRYHARGLEMWPWRCRMTARSSSSSTSPSTRCHSRWSGIRDGQIGRKFLGVLGTPKTFIVDKSGHLVSKTVGEIDFDKLQRFLDGALS